MRGAPCSRQVLVPMQVVKVKRAKEMSRHVRARNNSKRRAERVKELRKISHVAKERLSDVRRSLSDVPRVTRSRPGDAEREMASRRLFKTGNQLGTSTRRPKRTCAASHMRVCVRVF